MNYFHRFKKPFAIATRITKDDRGNIVYHNDVVFVEQADESQVKTRIDITKAERVMPSTELLARMEEGLITQQLVPGS